MPNVQTIMTTDVQTIAGSGSLHDAARMMRERDIGDVIVVDDRGEPCGIVTDRDLVVRGMAEGRDPRQTEIDAVCSHQMVTVSPDDSVERAAQLMRERAIRRLPVAQDGRIVGIVSIGDLAVEKDPDSALADISAERPNT